MGSIERPRGCIAVASVFRAPALPQAEVLPPLAVTLRPPAPGSLCSLSYLSELALVRVSSGCDHSELILTRPAHSTERDIPLSLREVTGVRTSFPVGQGQGAVILV